MSEQSRTALVDPPADPAVALPESTDAATGPAPAGGPVLDEFPATRAAAPRISPIHSSEITARTFRTTFRGLDPEAVRGWLQLIEASQEALEDEVERLSRGWDELLLAAARLRAALSEPEGELAVRWEALARCLTETRPNPELSATTTGFARAALDEAARGRRSAQAALFDAATQLARLQHETAVLRHENEQLRSRLIETVAGTAR